MENFKNHHSDWIVMSQTSTNPWLLEGPCEVACLCVTPITSARKSYQCEVFRHILS